MLKPGDSWGDTDITNPSYFAPAYYRVFGQVTGREAEWQQVIDSSYEIINRSLNAASGNAENGLVPAWCDSQGTPVEAYAGAPTHFQNDSTRTPFRVAQDYCYYGEPRAISFAAGLPWLSLVRAARRRGGGARREHRPRPDRCRSHFRHRPPSPRIRCPIPACRQAANRFPSRPGHRKGTSGGLANSFTAGDPQ